MDHIIYKENRIVLMARYDDPKVHSHFAKHILISDKPFLCKTNLQSRSAHSAIIQSKIPHHIERSENSRMIVFLIDETSKLSRALDEFYLNGEAEVAIPLSLENRVIEKISQGISLEEIDHFIIGELVSDKERQYPPSESRIVEAMKMIEEIESIEPDIYDLMAKGAFLSKSRFLHLFKEETGIDLKNYLLIKKLEKTYYYVTKMKMNITDAAIKAGFSSASHFSSACKKHYGISLSDFLKAQKK